MKSATIIACLALFGAVMASDPFCYKDASCGPSSTAWASVCRQGRRQSPINIPLVFPSGVTSLRMLGAYKGNSFRMQNSGHSVSVDFVGENGQNVGPTARTFTFPDPLNPFVKRAYKFASAHFHWGANNNAGSEHTINSRSSAMEAHFVHYDARYNSLAAAVASGGESALTVLGTMVNVVIPVTLFGAAISKTGHPSLAPIVKNLHRVREASHDGGFVRINEPIDFSPLINNGYGQKVYTYKGSLTTPGCNEQVNWFLLKHPAIASANDLQVFRSTIKDSSNAILDVNHRPVKPLNGRAVRLLGVLPTF